MNEQFNEEVTNNMMYTQKAKHRCTDINTNDDGGRCNTMVDDGITNTRTTESHEEVYLPII